MRLEQISGPRGFVRVSSSPHSTLDEYGWGWRRDDAARFSFEVAVNGPNSGRRYAPFDGDFKFDVHTGFEECLIHVDTFRELFNTFYDAPAWNEIWQDAANGKSVRTEIRIALPGARQGGGTDASALLRITGNRTLFGHDGTDRILLGRSWFRNIVYAFHRLQPQDLIIQDGHYFFKYLMAPRLRYQRRVVDNPVR